MDVMTIIEALMKHPQALVGFVLFGAGIGAIVHDVRLHMKVAATRHWLAAEGHIASGAIRIEHHTGTGFCAGSHTPGVYAAHIEYEYAVGGVKHRGGNIAPGGVVSTSSRARAEEWLTEYPEGSRVTVFYNPMNPDESCLRREKHGTLLTMLVALFFMGVGTALVITSRA
jgi:hypothetical protein